MAEKKLNSKQKRFCLAYVSNGRNATAAYQLVNPKARANTAGVGGSQYLRNPIISSEIDRLVEQEFKREHMGASEALATMARIARSDVGDLVWKPGELDSAGNQTQTGVIKPLYEMPEAIRKCIKSLKWDILGRPEFSFWNKDIALTNELKHHKLISDKLEVSVQVGFADRLRRAREKRLAAKKS